MTLPFFSSPTDPAPALLADRERTLAALYRQAYPLVRRYVRRHGGHALDAQDVFQDALVIFYEKAVAGELALTVPASQYLLGVSRHLWQRERERRHRFTTEDLSAAHDQQPDEPAAETSVSVLDFVERLGERCRTVLLAFYYFRQPLAQIAAAQQYATVRSATVQKYKCLERLRNAVRARTSAAELRAADHS